MYLNDIYHIAASICTNRAVDCGLKCHAWVAGVYTEGHPGDIPEGWEGVVSWIGLVLQVGIMREE